MKEIKDAYAFEEGKLYWVTIDSGNEKEVIKMDEWLKKIHPNNPFIVTSNKCKPVSSDFFIPKDKVKEVLKLIQDFINWLAKKKEIEKYPKLKELRNKIEGLNL